MRHIYQLRKDFILIGLTGRLGNGCTKIAEILSYEKDKFFQDSFLRKPEKINIAGTDGELIYDDVLFQKKYLQCYNYLNTNWSRFACIDYKKALILYCFHYYINIKKSKNFINDFSKFIINCYSKALKDGNLFDDTNKKISKKEIEKLFKTINLKEFKKEIRSICKRDNLLEIKEPEDLKSLFNIFFQKGSSYSKLFGSILRLMTKKNYYLRVFFFHKVAVNIRKSGKPDGKGESSMDNVFTIARLINRLIKAYKNEACNKYYCHIVINSLKNSLEIMYFKERYSAFYMMAVHNERDRTELFNLIVKNEEYKFNTVERLINLDNFEYLTNDFKRGVFSSPDIENCIQKSEIHIIYSKQENLDNLPNEFYTLHEQILKYLSLIKQPGIITPSNIERCMQIAFNSKLNSGCISRQVGAVVTNQGFAVKAIGWNDTPKSTIPCLLRNVEEVINGSYLGPNDHTYSKFELPESNRKYVEKLKNDTIVNSKYSGNNFSENVRINYPLDKIEKIKKEGKICAYCFKTLHNKFEGEDNQVHTRSLHAEENAMLQISKHGGQGLKDGFLFVTASPCELCSKKSYQLGITKIYYIDMYPGISKEHIIGVGFDAPILFQFKGAVGRSFNKFYEPFIAYKDELNIYLNG
jgi:deoxycytidylate deaminase/ferritin-like protein